MSFAAHPALANLRALSARLGSDSRLIQAGGGNTSIKQDDKLWIKASGKWLIHAKTEEMFVPVPLAALRACIQEGREYESEHRTCTGESLRPSIEVTLHALLPHQTVLHVHSVNAIAWAVRQDTPERLTVLLAGLRWQWIPYVRPGLPLAHRVSQRMSAAPDVLILGNHGLVVAGDSCEEADALLREVEKRLFIIPRPAPRPQWDYLCHLAEGSEWRVPAEKMIHHLATDPANAQIAAAGTLFPDHSTFIGPAAALLRPGESISEAVAGYQMRYGQAPLALLVEELGVLVAKEASPAALELLRCVAEVTTRVDPDAPRNYLSESEVAALRNWDSEKYRLVVASKQATRHAGSGAVRFYAKGSAIA